MRAADSVRCSLVFVHFLSCFVGSSLSAKPLRSAAVGVIATEQLQLGASGSTKVIDTGYFRFVHDPSVDDLVRSGSKGKRKRTRRSCCNRLAGQIEGCLIVFERMMMSARAYSSKGVAELMGSTAGQNVLRHLCSEYEQSMQCLHDSLITCPPDEAHLYLIAYRLGHVRSAMEQTCVELSRSSTQPTPTLSLSFPASTVVTTPDLSAVIVSKAVIGVGGELNSATGNTQEARPRFVERSELPTAKASPSAPIPFAAAAAASAADAASAAAVNFEDHQHQWQTDSSPTQRRAANSSPAKFAQYSLTLICVAIASRLRTRFTVT